MKTQAPLAPCLAAAFLALATLGVSQVSAQKARSENDGRERLGLGNISPRWAPDFNDPLPLKSSPPGPIGRRKSPKDPWWDLNGSTAGSGGPSPNGIWSTSVANWNPLADGTGVVANWVNGNAAVFSAGSDATGSYTVTVSGSVTASTITFEEGTVTLAGTATPVLTISAGITINSTVSGPTTFNSTLGDIFLTGTQSWTNNSSHTFNIASGITEAAGNSPLKILTFTGSGNIAVSGAITGTNDDLAVMKDGTGTLTLNGLNTYSEPTTINGGILEANTLADGGSASSIGASGTAATNLVINGGTLRYIGSGNSTNRNFTIGVNGATLDASGTGAVNFTNVNAANFSGVGSRTLTLTGSNTGANTLRGPIENQGANATSLVKNGSGSWTIAGNSGYTGTTTINSGTLTVDDVMGSASEGKLNNTVSITVNSGGTLALSGASNETMRINDAAAMVLNGGTFKTGGLSEGSTNNNGTGIGALTLTATSTIDFGASNTSLLRFAGLGAHTGGTVLQLTNWNGVPLTGGSGDRLLFTGDPSEFTALYDQNEVSFNGLLGYATADFGTFYEVTAVPEPSTWIGAALVIGVLGWNQLRKRSRTGGVGSTCERFRSLCDWIK